MAVGGGPDVEVEVTAFTYGMEGVTYPDRDVHSLRASTGHDVVPPFDVSLIMVLSQ